MDVQDYAATNDHAYHEVRNHHYHHHHHHHIIIIIIVISIIIIAIATNERETQISKSIFPLAHCLFMYSKYLAIYPPAFANLDIPDQVKMVVFANLDVPDQAKMVVFANLDVPDQAKMVVFLQKSLLITLSLR